MNLVSTQELCKVNKGICANNYHGYSYDREIIFRCEHFTLTNNVNFNAQFRI